MNDLRVSTPGERQIWERITRHLNCWRLDRNYPLDTHRYYLAYSHEGKTPVLRMKDENGLAEWRTRYWHESRLFPDPPPTIEDVTVQVLEVLESSLELSIDEFPLARPWVSFGYEGCRVVLGFSDSAPSLTARPLWGASSMGGIEAALCDAGTPITTFHRFKPCRGFRWRAMYGGDWFFLVPGEDRRLGPRRPCPPRRGGPIHGVASEDGTSGHCAVPGATVKIEAGGAFDADAILEIDSDGRAIARAEGLGVLRALEQGLAGEIVSAVFV